MRPLLVLFAGGCYAATPPTGAPCDPAAPRCPRGQACIASTCQPEGTVLPEDAAPSARDCPADPDLLLCLSFDAPVLMSPLANEGVLLTAAAFTDVAPAPFGAGGIAVFGATSTMQFPASDAIAGVLAVEATVRLDAEPPALSRVGIIDGDISNAGISLYVYAGTPHRINCTLGADATFADTTIALGAWTTLACSCENSTTVIRRDGAVIGSAAGCAAGSAETNGLQIGQNNRGAMPPNEPFIGAMDRVRVWKRLPQ